MICPCKDCEKKGCGNYHDKCKKYQTFVKWKNEINEKERLTKKLYCKGEKNGKTNSLEKRSW